MKIVVIKNRKGGLLQKAMAVLLSAALTLGTLWAAPVNVMAQGSGEFQGSVSGNDTDPKESQGTSQDESGFRDAALEGAESREGDFAQKVGDSESGESGSESGGSEEESREPGSVSGNDAEMTESAAPQQTMETAGVVAEEDMIMTAADDGTAAPGNITSDQTWSTQTLTAGTYTISSGVTVIVSGKLTVTGNVTINGGGTLRWSSAGGYGNALEVQEGAQLTLENITLDGNKITFSLSALLLKGNVTFNSGTVIQNFATRGSSGSSAGYKGVIAVYEKGVLNIYDGVTIKGNECGSGIIALYQFDSGNSGLADSTATVNMYGGTITGNTVKSVVSDMGVIWNWCGNLNISSGTVTAEGGEYAVHTQGNNKSYNATTVISGGTFTGTKNGAVCAGKDSGNRSVIKITGGSFTGKNAATVNYGTIEIRGGVYNGTEYALSSSGYGALEVYGGEFTGGTKAYYGTINTNTAKVIVGESKDTAANWDRSTSLNTYKYVAIGELTPPIPSHQHTPVKHEKVSADCTHPGTGEYWKCEGTTGCGRMFSDQACTAEISQIPVIPAPGHSYESTWKKDASGHWHECSRCGARADEAGHSLGGWQSDENGHWKICTDCNYQTAAAAHTYDNDGDMSCNDCGRDRLGADKTPPTGSIKIDGRTWEELSDSIAFDLFFNKEKQAVIQGQDTAGGICSGLDKVYYYVSDRELSKAELEAHTAWTEGGAVTLTPDRKCVVYAKITDKAGNKTYLSTGGLVLDATPPAIDGVTEGAVYRGPKTVTVTDGNLQAVKVNGAEVTLTNNSFTLEAVSGPQTIAAEDKAGNRSTVTVTVKTAAENVNDAKAAVERALKAVTVSNNTTEDAICGAIDAALKKEGISSGDVKIALRDFTKTEATTGNTGSLRGTVAIVSTQDGSVSDSVELNKTIPAIGGGQCYRRR